LKILQIGGREMDILNGFLDGKYNNSKDIILGVLILVLVLGFGKNTGLNLFNNGDDRSRRHHRKKRVKDCSSPGG
jgi:hypothetical protein